MSDSVFPVPRTNTDPTEALRLAARATPGPWTRVHPDSNFLRCPSCDQGEYVAKAIDSMYGEPHHMDEDVEFIAAARSLVPALASELLAARVELAAVTEQRNKLQWQLQSVLLDGDALDRQAAEARAQLAAVTTVVERVKALHQPHEVKHYPLGTELDGQHRPIDGQPFEIRMHCGTCDCPHNDWPCATARAAALMEGKQ